jgi:oxygen-independent coproporphyrinogen III oxidase
MSLRLVAGRPYKDAGNYSQHTPCTGNRTGACADRLTRISRGHMKQHIVFDAGLIRRYDQSGPRYTSYPTAAQFHDGISEKDYVVWARHSNEDPIPRPLSIYIHIPFCDTVCFYCACNKVVTRNHARATDYLDHLYREIAIQGKLFDRDRVVEQLHWGGGTPTFLETDQMRALMEKIGQHFTLAANDSGEFSIEIDPRSADYAKLKALRQAGFNRVSFGVQDLNPQVQKAVNRIQSEDKTREVATAARALGYTSINVDLMYGLPFQNVESFEETLRHVVEINPDRLAVYNYAHLPQRFKPQRRIYESDLPSADEKLNILQSTIGLLSDAGYVYIGMDHFAKPDDELAVAQRDGTLQRNFQGYSTHADCDLISMGVSAISKVCDNFSQNVRDLEAYCRLIDASRLPIDRGFEVEPDDLLRRDIITQIMCNFFLDIPAAEKKWRFIFPEKFRTEIADLQQMQTDGLLKLDAKALEVLPVGRLLVRNICMVFDHYLKGGGQSSRFSKVI